MAEPGDKTYPGPWEQFHRLRREQERLEDEARAAADGALDAVGLPSAAELGGRLDDVLTTIEEAIPVPERFRPHLPRPWETWRDIEHGVDFVADQLDGALWTFDDDADDVQQCRAWRSPAMSTSASTEPTALSDLDPAKEHDALMRPIINHTPFAVRLGIFTHPDRSRSLSAVLAATFTIPAEDGAVCELARDQLVPQPLPSYFGERGRSSIRRPADVVPYKPGTDVVVVGHAYAPHGRPATELTASVTVGDLHKSLAVVGDRTWRRTDIGLDMTEPEPFERMPLVYERAFGGCPPSQSGEARPDRDERNPVGTGYCVIEHDAGGMRLPNLEAPEARITSWRTVPPITGFGAVDAHWAGRRCFAGTFDTQWRANQRPYLPRDLDPRFYSVASPGLWSPVSLFGELVVELVHLSPTPVLRFRLPEIRVHMDFQLGGLVQERHAELWTIVLEPDERRVSMVWGARCRDVAHRTPSDRIEIRTEILTTPQAIPHAS